MSFIIFFNKISKNKYLILFILIAIVLGIYFIFGTNMTSKPEAKQEAKQESKANHESACKISFS